MSRKHLFHPSLLILSSLMVSVGLIEATCRMVGYDFEHRIERLQRWPIYYRKLLIPVGSVFFRRPGPDAWTGRVLFTGLALTKALDRAYADEAELTVAYDAQGFRNPDTLTDWDVVVAGDSFTELGYLPYEALFTTQLGERLGVRVKNLGVGYTGPLTQIFYLSQYGMSPSTTQAILVFFEGNDVDDLEQEAARLRRWQETGTRETRAVKSQPSFLAALYEVFQDSVARHVRHRLGDQEKLYQNAMFQADTGEMPVTLDYMPPGTAELTEEQQTLLVGAVAGWADMARTHGLVPWLVYMPCKTRVLYGHVRWMPHAEPKLLRWRPTDLPRVLQRLAQEQGVGFIDATPALEEEAALGHLTYNPIWDTHLNARGSLVVARLMADALGPYMDFAPSQDTRHGDSL